MFTQSWLACFGKLQQGFGEAESGEQGYRGKIVAGVCIELHAALALTQTSPALKIASASNFPPPQNPHTYAQGNAQHHGCVTAMV